MTDQPNRPPTVASSEYTEEYYAACGGYEEFNETRGAVLPARLRIPFEAAGVRPGQAILDIGCGRGEILYHAAKAGAFAIGLDYAFAAVKIASENLAVIGAEHLERMGLQIADAQKLPLPAKSVDTIFMLDVVEHLYPRELSAAFDEASRVLKPGGKLVIHTMPNLWYYRFGYPLFRAAQQARGVSLPKNPRDRWPHIHTHVNEQTPTALRRALSGKGFSTRIWLQSTQDYERYNASRPMRAAMRFLTGAPLFRTIFCDDIFALCVRQDER